LPALEKGHIKKEPCGDGCGYALQGHDCKEFRRGAAEDRNLHKSTTKQEVWGYREVVATRFMEML